MKYIIERSFSSFVVSEAKEYSLPIKIIKVQKQGINIFGEALDDIKYTLTHYEKRFYCGKAVSSSMTYKNCLKFCQDNSLDLIRINIHSPHFTELDSRTFR